LKNGQNQVIFKNVKRSKTTTWIWNLHADAHDFDMQTKSLEDISRKIFSAHFGQLAIIFL
jgi:photosystem I P700 chlorophyll a apoprotein A1